jgi:N-acetyl-anhydromuramyl-L-alanine amidase AmpD
MRILDARNSLPKNRDPNRVWKMRKSSTVDTIVVHQAACKGATTRGIAKYHTSPTEDRDNNGRIDAWEVNHLSAKGSPGICYHYTIEPGGLVYKCNSHWDVVWNAGSKRVNERSIGICLLGDFSGPDYVGKEEPTKAQLKSLEELIDVLRTSDVWTIPDKNIKGHCDVKKSKKSCPGTITMNTIKNTYRT